MMIHLPFIIVVCLLWTISSVDALSKAPTKYPTHVPSAQPTKSPAPTRVPTAMPTLYPAIPTRRPRTQNPSSVPTSKPSAVPTTNRRIPSPYPTSQPTRVPSGQPSSLPSMQPSMQPTSEPSMQPSSEPTAPTGQPSSSPTGTKYPTSQPSVQPTTAPTISHKPTRAPSTERPTKTPTEAPTVVPSAAPTRFPTTPSFAPTALPTRVPTAVPTRRPTALPTIQPSMPTQVPTSQPSEQPHGSPSSKPSMQPTSQPSSDPSRQPTSKPTFTLAPVIPTSQPSSMPSRQPTTRPTTSPTITPDPTKHPTSQPSQGPSSQPSSQPTSEPSLQPTSRPTAPTSQPSSSPTQQPTVQPTGHPSRQPTSQPSIEPSSQPSSRPTSPTGQPSGCPSSQPSGQPTVTPTISQKPTFLPSLSNPPTSQPTSGPSGQPNAEPSSSPTISPAPTSRPSAQPIPKPTSRPSFEDYATGGFTESPTSYYQGVGIDGLVTFIPGVKGHGERRTLSDAVDDQEPCMPVEIKITIQFGRNLTQDSYFYIGAPGLTTGSCFTPVDGSDLAAVYIADHYSNAYQLNEPSFAGTYTEGTYQNNYADSKFSFRVQDGFIDSTKIYTLILDRSNGFRKTCSQNNSWNVEVEPYLLTKGISGSIDLLETYPKKCPLYFSEIAYDSPHQQLTTGINMTFQIGFNFDYNTYFEVALPGFTNSRGDYPLNFRNITRDYMDLGFNRQLTNLTWGGTNISYIGNWIEGDYTDGYAGSKLQLVAKGYHKANDRFWIFVPKENNRIVPTCGYSRNNTAITLKVNSSYYYSEEAPFVFSAPVGPGCDLLNSCSGHGKCNYCDSKCECYEGYGSERDKSFAFTQDFAPDCSSKSCPLGRSKGQLYDYGEARDRDGVSMHPLTECSDNGVCDRKTGSCKCFEGYTGMNCQKQVCHKGGGGGGGDGEVCSGRGRCLSMAQLARADDALPLSDIERHPRKDPWTNSRYWGFRGRKDDNVFYNDVNFTGVRDEGWDVDFGHTCVCDSRWAVGLRDGESQLAEYFGPNCQHRRCPSGDDPNTIHVDETNCTGVSMTGGSHVGELGNLCHVDCSNRGTCNYNTGICSCYSGYTGIACNIRIEQCTASETGVGC